MQSEGIYFFHIPKTAGVSVWHFLEQVFPAEKICPWWLWDQLISVPRAELDQWQVFRGHFLSHLGPYLNRPLKTFTQLRDPVKRTISYYHHIRRAPEHPCHNRTVQLSLAEFCIHPETRHLVENYQAAYLAKSPVDPTVIAKELPAKCLEHFELQRRVEHPDRIADPAELFERAEARLATFSAVGITDGFESSLREISKALGWPPPSSFAPRNVRPDPRSDDEVDPATLALIRDLTRVDQRLYDVVVSRSPRLSVPGNAHADCCDKNVISYAQNFEDVILNRVFQDRKDGFYIDVGAWDPVLDSVTKLFYDRGWSGINVEPNEVFYSKLVQQRPRDINLNIALGEQEESRPLYVFEQFGNSTFEEGSRDRFTEEGHDAQQKTVIVKTLAAVCEEHVTRSIDFLKVDCEGWEKFVLKGADWDRFRPIVLIVEATQPGTELPTWKEWEPFLIENARYDMVYFDGLNRFYLRRESSELRSHFEVPPNVFDNFKLYATEKAERMTLTLQEEQTRLRERIAEQEAEGERAQSQMTELKAQARTDAAEIARLTAELLSVQTHVLSLQTDVLSLQTNVSELEQKLLKARLWIGQLSQEVAANKMR